MAKTPEERVIEAVSVARTVIEEAIGETRFAISLSTRLYLHQQAPVGEEYLFAAITGLHEVRDLIEQALPPVAVAGEEEQDG